MTVMQAVTIQWTGLLDWTTGFTETASGRNIPRFDSAIQKRHGYLASLPVPGLLHRAQYSDCSIMVQVSVHVFAESDQKLEPVIPETRLSKTWPRAQALHSKDKIRSRKPRF